MDLRARIGKCLAGRSDKKEEFGNLKGSQKLNFDFHICIINTLFKEAH